MTGSSLLTWFTQASSTLSITLQQASDLDRILHELGTLNLSIEQEEVGQEDTSYLGPTASGSWAPQSQSGFAVYRPSSNPRQVNNASPPLVTRPGSQAMYPAFPEGHTHTAGHYRPPSQPLGQPPDLSVGPRPWSPALVPSRPATAIGVPGIMGEGIYKVSKIGSTTSNRPRVRRTSSISEHQRPMLYTVSKHFDKTLGRADILHSSRARYLGQGRSSGLAVGNFADYPFKPPGLGLGSTKQPPMALDGVQGSTQHQTQLRRLRTVDDGLGLSPSARFDDTEHRSLLTTLEEDRAKVAFSQPGPTRGPIDDVALFSSSPTLLGLPTKQELVDEWLVEISHIQHQGLCEATRVWEDLMGRAAVDVASAKSSGDVSDVLSKFEQEFVRRWEGVVATTAGKMRQVRPGGSGF